MKGLGRGTTSAHQNRCMARHRTIQFARKVIESLTAMATKDLPSPFATQDTLVSEHGPEARHLEIGCRIPKEYFWIVGWGESDVGIEAGSYDAALTMAGIENYNVMLYTSVLSPEAIELPDLPNIHHGSVLEGIIAVQHTEREGTRITAGLLLAKVYRQRDDSYLGGFACEYAGNGSLQEAESNLHEAMKELFARRYASGLYKLELAKSVIRTFTPSKPFGTILVGIGFASYLVPVLRTAAGFVPSHKDKSHVSYTTS